MIQKATDDEVKTYINNNFYFDLDNKVKWRKGDKEVYFYKNKNGYYSKCLTVKLNTKKTVGLHRIIYFLFTGIFNSKLRINHIDGNVENNNINNLEIINNKDNSSYKTKLNSRNSSGFNGVSWNKKNKKWRAHIMINGKKIYLGLFIDIKDAVFFRDEYIVENGLPHTTSTKLQNMIDGRL